MMLLTDGTVMVLSSVDYQTWMRLTPDPKGGYINASWTQTPGSKMISPRLDFASQVLPSGKLWVMGGEYSGPGIPGNLGYFAETFDPTTNTWSAAAPFPNMSGCRVAQFGGLIASGSPIVTDIVSTAGWKVGWSITPLVEPGIAQGAVIASVDSPTQVHLSANATATRAVRFTLNPQITGNTVAGNFAITGVSSTDGIMPGSSISGPGIPAQTYVTSVSAVTNSIVISQKATATAEGVTLTLTAILPAPSCAGDLISILLPGPKILTGSIVSNNCYLYDPISDTWSQGPKKAFNDTSSEEGWARLGDGTIVTYDIGQSVVEGTGYAERYDPVTNKWSPISPVNRSANGVLPLLSSASLSYEIGPLVRLEDDRIFVIGANGHTSLYTPSTNTWAAGPDMIVLWANSRSCLRRTTRRLLSFPTGT